MVSECKGDSGSEPGRHCRNQGSTKGRQAGVGTYSSCSCRWILGDEQRRRGRGQSRSDDDGDGLGRRWYGRGAGAELGADRLGELLQLVLLDVEDPLKGPAHLALHLVDLAQGKHALTDNTSRFVGVGIVADHFAGDHEGRDK